MQIAGSVQPLVYEIDLWVTKGDQIKGFEGANDAIGTLVLRCETEEQMLDLIKNQKEWLKVVC